MFIDWQSQTYEQVNLGIADREFLKQGGHAGFDLAFQKWLPSQAQEFISTRFSIVAKLVQTHLAKIAQWPNQLVRVESEIEASRKEKPIQI